MRVVGAPSRQGQQAEALAQEARPPERGSPTHRCGAAFRFVLMRRWVVAVEAACCRYHTGALANPAPSSTQQVY